LMIQAQPVLDGVITVQRPEWATHDINGFLEAIKDAVVSMTEAWQLWSAIRKFEQKWCAIEFANRLVNVVNNVDFVCCAELSKVLQPLDWLNGHLDGDLFREFKLRWKALSTKKTLPSTQTSIPTICTCS